MDYAISALTAEKLLTLQVVCVKVFGPETTEEDVRILAFRLRNTYLGERFRRAEDFIRAAQDEAEAILAQRRRKGIGRSHSMPLRLA